MEIRQKAKKQNSNVCQAECRKENADDYHAIEKAKSKRIEEMDLYNERFKLMKNNKRVDIQVIYGK